MEISQLGANIKQFREEKGWSLNKLKEESRVGYATLHDIESGKSQNLKSDTIEKVAKALNKSVDDLLGVEYEIIEYAVGDFRDTINQILNSDEISIDGIPMTEQEKEKALEFSEIFIEMIRKERKK